MVVNADSSRILSREVGTVLSVEVVLVVLLMYWGAVMVSLSVNGNYVRKKGLKLPVG